MILLTLKQERFCNQRLNKDLILVYEWGSRGPHDYAKIKSFVNGFAYAKPVLAIARVYTQAVLANTDIKRVHLLPTKVNRRTPSNTRKVSVYYITFREK